MLFNQSLQLMQKNLRTETETREDTIEAISSPTRGSYSTTPTSAPSTTPTTSTPSTTPASGGTYSAPATPTPAPSSTPSTPAPSTSGSQVVAVAVVDMEEDTNV